MRTASGKIFLGSYIENVAFNPSLPPLETALAGILRQATVQKCSRLCW